MRPGASPPRQHIAVRTDSPANNIWSRLDNYFAALGGAAAPGYADFREAEAYLSELKDGGVGWLHHLTGGAGLEARRLSHDRYTAAVAVAAGMQAGAARGAARTFLQTLYGDVPFDEMKRPVAIGGVPAYDPNEIVRPPQ